MKKVIIIAMLFTILCVCGLSAGVCFADETSSYYYVEQGKELKVYLTSQMSANAVTMQIPSTYAFEYLNKENNEFVKIKYNGHTGYVLLSDFNNCVQVNEKWGNNPYFFTFDTSKYKTFASEEVAIYQFEGNVLSTVDISTAKYIEVTSVYGYLNNGSDIYMLVDYKKSLGSTSIDKQNCYIKLSDFANAPSVDNIPDSKGYTLQTTPDKPTPPSGEINSGNPNTPSLDNNGTDTQTPKNSLDRYILIAVIAVLCVVIIILIFVPNKKKQN